MKHIYFLFVLTAVGSSIMTIYAPAIVVRIKRYFTERKRTSAIDATMVIELQSQIDEMKEQINNMAKQLTNRDYNTKKVVREYLTSLRDK